METLGHNIAWKVGLYFKPLDNADLYLADDLEIIPRFKKIGCYVAPKEFESYENKEDLLESLDLYAGNEELNEDIVSIFTTELWVSSDFYRFRYANQWDKKGGPLFCSSNMPNEQC